MANYIQDVSSSIPKGGYSVAQLQNIAQRAGIGAQTPPQAPTTPATPSNLDSNTFALTPDELALQSAREAKINASKTASEAQVTNESDYQNQALNAMQAEIDAVNKIYAQKLQQAQQEGKGRLGSEGAIQARRGLLGSDFGAAQTQDIRTMNTGVENAVQAELGAKLAEIMDKARSAGSEKYAAAAKAKKEGLDAYLADIAGRGEANKKIALERAKHFMISGVDPNTLDKTTLDSIAKAAGVTSDSILSYYKDETDAQKLADAKAQQEGAFNLNEGQARYDANGKLIASRGKTYAPSSGSSAVKMVAGAEGGTSTYTAGQNPVVDAWAARISNGQAKLSDITGNGAAEIKNRVVTALNGMSGGKLSAVQSNLAEAKKLVEELKVHPGRTATTGVPSILTNPLGFSLPASDSRDFKAKVDRLNALLFLNAVPQMRGLGALTEREGAKLSASQSITQNTGISDSQYLQELGRLSKQIDSSYKAIGGGYTEDLGNVTAEEQALLDQGFTQDQIDQLKNSN